MPNTEEISEDIKNQSENQRCYDLFINTCRQQRIGTKYAFYAAIRIFVVSAAQIGLDEKLFLSVTDEMLCQFLDIIKTRGVYKKIDSFDHTKTEQDIRFETRSFNILSDVILLEKLSANQVLDTSSQLIISTGYSLGLNEKYFNEILREAKKSFLSMIHK